MEAKTLITPSLRGTLDQNAAQLCDHFLIREASAVPVEAFTIDSDGVRQTFTVEEDQYQTALWLLHCALPAMAPTYELTRQLKRLLPRYYCDDQLVVEASRPGTTHQALRLMLGDQVDIELRLRAGYELPLYSGREARELIEFGWQIRDAILAGRPSPLIRGAVTLFMGDVRNERIRIIESADPNVWPSLPWLERVKTLSEHLKIEDF